MVEQEGEIFLIESNLETFNTKQRKQIQLRVFLRWGQGGTHLPPPPPTPFFLAPFWKINQGFI